MSDPRISFIVSAYDRPDALKLCLLSLILQTEHNWEAIVTDNNPVALHSAFTLQVVQELDDSRIRYLHTGHSAPECYRAAEIAAEVAHGDFLCFPSDDSYYAPYFAERLLALADQNSFELVFSDLVIIGPDNAIVLPCAAACCHIDKTNFLLKRSRFTEFPGKSLEQGGRSCSDGLLIDEVVRQGIMLGKVAQPLVIHN